VPEKTNEITAIPDILDQLAAAGQLKGALVALDAMGCQVEIASKIVAHGADYLLPLKGNQPILEAEVEDYFRTAPAAETVSQTTVEKGHGHGFQRGRLNCERPKLSGKATVSPHQDHRQSLFPHRTPRSMQFRHPTLHLLRTLQH
jgi:predicted transposase YbfD/YdcC